jgi:SAM-dependent methyltransferase
VNPDGAVALRAFLHSPAAEKWTTRQSLVGTVEMDGPNCEALLANHPGVAELFARVGGAAMFEHEVIPFPSFPYEWSPEMLHAAAVLTLELAIHLLPQGMGLKDATPYNILFRGPRPVFIDVLSFERRDPGDPIWLPYAQFVRTFLLPLLAARHFGMTLDQLLFVRRDGLEPKEVYGWLGPARRICYPFLSLVSAPVWLAARRGREDPSLYRRKCLKNPERVRFILLSLLNGLQRKLAVAAPKDGSTSGWSEYMEAGEAYSSVQFTEKEHFVAEFLSAQSPKSVLDVGCNTGYFSFLAARAGARVVAIDRDSTVIGHVWRRAFAEDLDVLPLVVNLARPTPGMGWSNQECGSFLDRARGKFDVLMMLAVLHHLLITERVPLRAIVDLAAELTTDHLLIEFVEPEDAMFRGLGRGREGLYRDLTVAAFEADCRRRFEIVHWCRLRGSSRRLYWMRRRNGSN